jgi:hypothetical protein
MEKNAMNELTIGFSGIHAEGVYAITAAIIIVIALRWLRR